MNHTNVFVYGTLRFGFGLNHVLREGGAQFVGERTLEGFELYDMGSYPCVRKVDDTTALVVGEVYRVDNELLRQLDMIEGFRGTVGSRGNHYDRLSVATQDGLDVHLYVYPETRNFKRWRRVEGGNYTLDRLARRDRERYASIVLLRDITLGVIPVQPGFDVVSREGQR